MLLQYIIVLLLSNNFTLWIFSCAPWQLFAPLLSPRGLPHRSQIAVLTITYCISGTTWSGLCFHTLPTIFKSTLLAFNKVEWRNKWRDIIIINFSEFLKSHIVFVLTKHKLKHLYVWIKTKISCNFLHSPCRYESRQEFHLDWTGYTWKWY